MTDEQMADESGWRAADHNARTDAAGLMILWESYADEKYDLAGGSDE